MNRRRHLERLLRHLTPMDADEARHRRRVEHLLTSPGDPFARDHWVPGHLTASAFVLSPDRSEVLLIFHGKLHRWLQPGGHIEAGEDVLTAARRELSEETALTDVEQIGEGLLDVDVHTIPPRRDEPGHDHFDVRLLFRARTRTFEAGSDAMDARWVPLADVHALESDESVLRAIHKIRACSGTPTTPPSPGGSPSPARS